MKNRTTKRLRPRYTVDKSRREQLLKAWLTYGAGLSTEELGRDRLRLDEIVIAPAAFQPRESGDDHRIPDHIEDLTQTARQQAETMEPILLFAIAGRRYVIDGHLRAEAFSRAGYEHIRVRHFHGTFHEALLKSVSENAKAKLSLTREQRTQSAWELVQESAANCRLYSEDMLRRLTPAERCALGCYSKADICKSSSVADGTVATMRRVLNDKNLGFKPRGMLWEKVRQKLSASDGSGDAYSEEKRLEKLERWTKGYRRVTGKGADKDPRTAMEAFDRACPRAAALLRDEGQADAEEALSGNT